MLDIWYRHPATVENSIAEHTEDIIVRRDRDSGKVIGITVLRLSKRSSAAPIQIPSAGDASETM